MPTAQRADIVRDVKQFILTNFLPGEDPSALTETTPLVSSGILDSLATLNLVSFIEQQYALELGARDTDPSRLGTLNDIATLVEGKLASRT